MSPSLVARPGYRELASVVARDLADELELRLENGDVTWVERLVRLLDTPAVHSAHEAARVAALTRRDTDPPDDPEAAE